MAKGAEAAGEIVGHIQRSYPNATYALVWRSPWELLVGTVLAAQSTDATINRVTASLFTRYPDIHAFAAAVPAELEEAIKPCGINQQKAKALLGCAHLIIERFNGEVPRTMDEMLELPGVKRKSANVVLNCGYGIASGVIVDTHVERLAQRIGLSAATTPEPIERDLMRLVPESEWTTFGPALILHGREVCKAKAPRCDDCVLEPTCMKVGVQ
jgi:endonuclease-3